MAKFYNLKDKTKGIPEDLFNKLDNIDYSKSENIKAVILELFSLAFRSLEIYKAENERIVNYIKELDKILQDARPLTDSQWWEELRKTTQSALNNNIDG